MAITTPAAGSVCERFEETARRHAGAVAIRSLDGTELLWGDYRERVRSGAAGLAGLGLRRGDVMACWLSNRPEFHVADAAAMHLGAASFSIYNTFALEQAKDVVADSGARIVVTESAYVERAIAVRESGETNLEHIVCVEGDAPEALGWDELLDAAPPGFDFEATWRAIAPTDLATVIYTSGTTGPPKGVELTHANLSAQTVSLTERLGLVEGMRSVSFLPMAHIAERLGAHYLPMFHGWEVNCCPDPRQVATALKAVRPGYFFAPPRIWEKLRAGILGGVDDPTRAALRAAIRRVRAESVPQDGPVQSAARASVGFDELAVALVGTTRCPPELIEFWHACGVRVSELYGLTETTGVAAVAGPHEVRIGTVGPPLSDCQVRLSERGEICIRGPVLTRGYRNLPELTAQARDAEGWWHSGDIGELDARGHLRVVDRINELMNSAAGKSMSPASIETAVKAEASLIGHVCVIGDARPFNVALITLDPDALRSFTEQREIRTNHPRHHREVIEAVRDKVARANARLADVEQIKRFALLAGEWPPDGDELTPTMKLKRRLIADKYAATIAALYDGSAGFASRY